MAKAKKVTFIKGERRSKADLNNDFDVQAMSEASFYDRVKDPESEDKFVILKSASDDKTYGCMLKDLAYAQDEAIARKIPEAGLPLHDSSGRTPRIGDEVVFNPNAKIGRKDGLLVIG